MNVFEILQEAQRNVSTLKRNLLMVVVGLVFSILLHLLVPVLGVVALIVLLPMAKAMFVLLRKNMKLLAVCKELQRTGAEPDYMQLRKMISEIVEKEGQL